MITPRAWVASVLGVALLFVAPAARAGDEAIAEALFVEAKKLVAKKKFAEACPKFAESNRLDRGAGTLIHLGDCYEKNKQTASAWATYKEAASAAQALGRKDWEKLATTRAAHLEPKLAYVTIKVEAPVEKLELKKDGAVLSQATWGVALPVDVGSHAIAASAEGYKPFATTVNVAKDGERLDVGVPKLEAIAREPAPTTAPAGGASASTPPKTTPPNAEAPHDERAPSEGSGQRTVGFIVGGVGIVGLGVGAITGLMAIGKNNDAKTLCPEAGTCGSREGVDANDSAKTLGLVSTIGFIAGGVFLAGGAALVLTAPSSNEKRVASLRLGPDVGADRAGLVAIGRF